MQQHTLDYTDGNHTLIDNLDLEDKFIEISDGQTLTVRSKKELTLNANSAIIIRDGGRLENDLLGKIINKPLGEIYNNDGGTINNNSGGTIDNNGGKINNEGTVDNNSGGEIFNDGEINNNSGGQITNYERGRIINWAGQINNNSGG